MSERSFRLKMFKLKRFLSNAVSASVNALTTARDAIVRLLDDNTDAGERPVSPPRNPSYRQQQQQQEPVEEGWEAVDYLEQPPQPRPIQVYPTSPENNGPIYDENRSAQSHSHVHVDYYANSHREDAAKHNRLMKEYYSKAREATKQREYEKARQYREKVCSI